MSARARSSSPRHPVMPAKTDPQMLRALTSAWLSEPRGRLVLVAWVATFSTVTIRALYLRRRAKKAQPKRK